MKQNLFVDIEYQNGEKETKKIKSEYAYCELMKDKNIFFCSLYDLKDNKQVGMASFCHGRISK